MAHKQPIKRTVGSMIKKAKAAGMGTMAMARKMVRHEAKKHERMEKKMDKMHK